MGHASVFAAGHIVNVLAQQLARMVLAVDTVLSGHPSCKRMPSACTNCNSEGLTNLLILPNVFGIIANSGACELMMRP